MSKKMYTILSIVSLLLNSIGLSIMLFKLYLNKDLPIILGILFTCIGVSLSSATMFFRTRAKK